METDTMVHTEIGTATDPNALCTLAVTHYNSSLASNVTKNTAKMSFFFTLLYILWKKNLAKHHAGTGQRSPLSW